MGSIKANSPPPLPGGAFERSKEKGSSASLELHALSGGRSARSEKLLQPSDLEDRVRGSLASRGGQGAQSRRPGGPLLRTIPARCGRGLRVRGVARRLGAERGPAGHAEFPRPRGRFLPAGRDAPPPCGLPRRLSGRAPSPEGTLPRRISGDPLPPGELFGRLRSGPFHSAKRNLRKSRSLHFSDGSDSDDLIAVESG